MFRLTKVLGILSSIAALAGSVGGCLHTVDGVPEVRSKPLTQHTQANTAPKPVPMLGVGF